MPLVNFTQEESATDVYQSCFRDLRDLREALVKYLPVYIALTLDNAFEEDITISSLNGHSSGSLAVSVLPAVSIKELVSWVSLSTFEI